MGIHTGVAKIIFYGYMCLQSHENVEFVTNSPTRCETVIDTQQLHLPIDSSYHNVFTNGDGYDFVFRNLFYSYGGSTCLYNTERKNIINVLQNMHHLNHNFCVFPSRCGTMYYGIGGEHCLGLFYGAEKKEEPTILYRGAKITSPDIHSIYHQNGLYLMQSPDMLHWDYVQKTPVISGIHPGHTENLFDCSRFDSKICCFYSEILQQYVIFVRANMGRRCRWVQTTRSKDAIHWEPLQLLQMEGVNFDKDNYYHFDAMEYPGTDLFVGLSAYTNKRRWATQVCIKLMFSKDGITWVDSGGILDTPISANGLRNSTQTTSVFFDRGEYYDMFFNENYNGILDPDKSSTVVKYRIPKDRLVGVKAGDVGRFEFDMGVRSNHLTLNYECQDDGYITFTINDDPEEVMLHGNSLEKHVRIDEKYIGQNIRINVEMKKATLYSCAS